MREKIENKIFNIKFKIKLKFIENMINLDSMFKKCEMLLRIENFSKFNTKYLKNLNCLFSQCSSLTYIDDI